LVGLTRSEIRLVVTATAISLGIVLGPARPHPASAPTPPADSPPGIGVGVAAAGFTAQHSWIDWPGAEDLLHEWEKKAR
jgi:hypothetical protein